MVEEVVPVLTLEVSEVQQLMYKFCRPFLRRSSGADGFVASALDNFELRRNPALCKVFPPESIRMTNEKLNGLGQPHPMSTFFHCSTALRTEVMCN